MGFLSFLLPKEKVYPVELNVDNFYPSIKNSPVPVIVDFYVDKSMPCAQLYQTLTKFATDFKGRVRVGAFNAMQDSEGRILAPLKIKAVPTLVYFYKGEPVEVSEGVAGYLVIQEVIEKIEAKGAAPAKK